MERAPDSRIGPGRGGGGWWLVLGMKTRKSGGRLSGGRLPELTAGTLRAGWVSQFGVSQSHSLEGTETSPGWGPKPSAL